MLHLRAPQSLRSASASQDPPLGRYSTSAAFDWSLGLGEGVKHLHVQPPRSSQPSHLLPGVCESSHLPAIAEGYTAPCFQDKSTPGDMSRNIYDSGSASQYGSYSQPLATPQQDYDQTQLNLKSHNGYGNATVANHAIHQGQHGLSGSNSSSRPPSRPESPVFHSDDQPTPSRRGSHPGGIVSYLQIPSTISSSKGSLAEFAAQITCLFWFESSSTLASIEASERSPVPTSRLVPEAMPVTGFLKWVTTILSTTQVTQNVILLALLFIYRLKKQNPTVKGKPGSEYRLLTVALMLGNKFLDDNTYTNKTWAEVSGISVQEIHVMEVEFLSHMKYNLYTSKESWHEWHMSLGKFWTYFDRASRKLADVMPGARRPPALQIPYTLPSPPASTNHSPPYASAMTPIGSIPYPTNPALFAPPLAPPQGSPAVSHPDIEPRFNGRKRSVDEYATEPPSKRLYGHHSGPSGSRSSSYMSHPSTSFSQQPSLPAPTSLPQPLQPLHTPTFSRTSTLTPISAERATHSQSLPPFAWSTSLAIPSLATAHHPATPVQSTVGHGSYAVQPTQHSSYPSSASHTTSQSSLSPSYFLHQRSSPYRPVRHMSTLLVPQPTNQVPQSANQIAYDQMHWQTLGKSQGQRHTGRVPYLHREAWPQSHQVEHWPSVFAVQGFN
ncbi:hypothetical protein FH972_024356 [Carpinus fangiana]|uniref:Cyclin N-terminal domain-containing protein n=1 Tax=Carpinus fangiana TaxID=176857 RepID=A0A5N6KXU1_9ROSI|nr:hypothetical protein FH972_024356 [Carpinus fangiana]